MPNSVFDELSNCRLCAERFAATKTQHEPRPVFRGDPSARILIAGQAPGARVHQSGLPFTDPSGDRLRDWMDVTEAEFYDPARIAILPMAFCFPGYNEKGADLPPRRFVPVHGARALWQRFQYSPDAGDRAICAEMAFATV